MVNELWLILGVATAGVLAIEDAALASPTSCDIVTGASCFYNEGCDCDHDGYVRSNGKAWRYCHFSKCPIDGNDGNADVLGVTSDQNADGDGWTTAYDCDDHDACVANDCTNTCGPPPPDADGDGFAVGADCDDNNYYVKPGASIACCSCEVLSNPSQVSAFHCASNPCPSGTTGGDASSAEDAGAPADTTTPVDTFDAFDATPNDIGGTAEVDVPLVDGSPGAVYQTPPGSPELVGAGTTQHAEQPPPGCEGGAAAAPLAALAVAVLLVRGVRRRRAVVLALTLSTGAAASGGCVTVQPWERGRLAKAPMIFGADPHGEGLEQHMFQYREGAAGGFGGGGGGCGCN